MLDEILKAVGVKDIAEINEPMVSAVGNHVVVVTNACGLISLADNMVEVKGNKSYKIVISGDLLECGMFNKNEIQVSGRINSVSWEKL